MAKYSKAAQQSVEDAMNDMKAGKLKTGTGAKVKNPKQAIAIGLSEAREKGAKVPPAKGAKKTAGKRFCLTANRVRMLHRKLTRKRWQVKKH